MLKLVEMCGIIYLVVRWNYMNNNVLISTAMLSSFWERERKDTLDLFIPFLKYSIAKTTSVGETIDISKMTQYFKKEFGYDTIPANVVSLMLKRLSPKSLKKNRDKYTLIENLDEDIKKFEKGHAQYEARYSKVATVLKDFLNEYLTLGRLYTEDSAMQALIEFFASNGICLIKNTALLEILKKKDDALQYAIAQFIIKESTAKTEVFSYIEDMVKGFFVSTAISLQPQNTTAIQAKFKGLKCYLDTRFVINALGLQLLEEEVAAKELIKMLKDKGAELYCFRHNYQEIDAIISAYKYDLNNPSEYSSTHTLARWDSENYTVTDVQRYESLLEAKISALGISIVSSPTISDTSKYPIDHKALAEHINKNMTYNHRSSIDTDVESVAATLILRGDNISSSVEKSGAIFVTSNIKLVSVVNGYLEQNEICSSEDEIMPMITDMELSSIVWLKCYATHKDYPQKRLIEHALTALEPSPTLLTTFFDMVDRIKAEGGITADEAAVIRADFFCRREMTIAVKGNQENLTQQTVYELRDKLKEQYIGEANKDSSISLKQYVEEREKNRGIVLKALEKVAELKKKVFKRVYTPLLVFAWVIIISLIICFAVISIIKLIHESNITFEVFLLFFGIAGTVDMLCSKLQYAKKFITYVANNISDMCADKKKEEYKDILRTVSDDMLE